MINIPIDWIIFVFCLAGSVYTSYTSGVSAGVLGCLRQLDKEGVIKLEENDSNQR